MNGIFLNSRGLGDLAKHTNIAQHVRDHKLDFLEISETGRRDFTSTILDRLSHGLDFTWHSCPPRGRLVACYLVLNRTLWNYWPCRMVNIILSSISVIRPTISCGVW